MEAFEKELNESKAKGGDEEEGEEEGGAAMDDIDEAELGEDPFARDVVTLDAGSEPWLGSDRDYTYPEASTTYNFLVECSNYLATVAPPSLLRATSCFQSSPSHFLWQTIHHCTTSSHP